MSIEFSGFDKLNNIIEQTQKFQKEIDNEIVNVSFDPFDAESIEMAIIESERIIDFKAEEYGDNEIIIGLASQMKSGVRQMIIDKASQARIEVDQGEEDGE